MTAWVGYKDIPPISRRWLRLLQLRLRRFFKSLPLHPKGRVRIVHERGCSTVGERNDQRHTVRLINIAVVATAGAAAADFDLVTVGNVGCQKNQRPVRRQSCGVANESAVHARRISNSAVPRRRANETSLMSSLQLASLIDQLRDPMRPLRGNDSRRNRKPSAQPICPPEILSQTDS